MSRSRPLVELGAHLLRGKGEPPFLVFDCPTCAEAHPIGIHIGPENVDGGGFRVWRAINADDLTKITTDPSILCRTPGCSFHGWIRNGLVTW